MSEIFQGKWRVKVTAKNAGFEHRFRITGANNGNGTYTGIVGSEAVIDGESWTITMEWNNGSGSGWQESAVLRSTGSISPIVIINILRADDNFPDQRDNDFDDLVITCTDLDPIFEVVQRPFALDRGTLTMFPDGIFEVSQGIQYMGVRVRNTWDFDWDAFTGVMIGIANSSRAALLSQGIKVIDSWTTQEQQALQQEVANGFAKIPALKKGAEHIVYFKMDVRNAGPSKPVIDFVAQRSAWDSAYDTLSRRVSRQIFISRSTYDPLTRELVAEIPEGTVFMRLNSIIVDKAAMEKAMLDALRKPCKHDPPRPGSKLGTPNNEYDKNRQREELKDFMEGLLSGKRIDPCKLRALLETCCEKGDGDGSGDSGGNPGEGGMGDGPGSDNWCRFKPFHWIPVEFEYRIVPNPAYVGQFGPLAFEDPWWKVVLIILAALLAAASLVYDYIKAGEDSNFVIGKITAKSARTTSNVDAAIALLNGSRGNDLNVLEAQGDDRNNGLPINGATGGTISIARSDNGDRGIEDPVAGNVVFKSGARSATTRGTISSISLNTSVEGINYTNQVLIVPLATPNNQPLSQGGDSGSLWVDLTSRRPVALNFAGPANDDGTNAIANPIRDVVNLFDIHFNV